MKNKRGGRGLWSCLGLGLLLAGCSSGPPAPPAGEAPATAAAAAAAQPQGNKAPAPAVAKGGAEALAPPKPVRTHDELRKQAALRLVQANPERTYMGEVPAVLLAIPVLEIELRQDGSVKNIHVLRKPGQALDTVQLAIDAVHRAAPFGNLARLPQPWKFNEVFLFNDERRFKPRTLD
ncbi:hypothetical protein [Paucibacter soli]|uniref:hypothetical protein n=1 Tax=Paucibacter soli TaxID=3133433 RepID=UPI003096B1AC